MPPPDHETRDHDAPFNAQWQETDTTHLAPNNLALSRVRRAWERKPLSPLSRQKLRVGKIWKRARPVAVPAFAGGSARDAVKVKVGAVQQSPMKPVKKMRVECEIGVGSRVSRWEGRGSPSRKIITRSAAGGMLVALAEEEEGDLELVEEAGDATIEVFDEDGRLVEGEEISCGGGAEQGWEDEEVPDAVLEDTPIHLVGARLLTSATAEETVIENTNSVHVYVDDIEAAAEIYQSQERLAQPLTSTVTLQPALTLPKATPVVLPEGFVSPVKQRRKLGPRSLRTISAARRQTLPVQFAPAILPPTREEVIRVGEFAAEIVESAGNSGAQNEETTSIKTAQDTKVVDSVEAVSTAARVSSPNAVEPTPTPGIAADVADVDATAGADDAWEDVEENEDEMTDVDSATQPGLGGERIQEADKALKDVDPHCSISDVELFVPSLQPRRSLRRRSSSPRKENTTTQQHSRPHIVAFTPLKQTNDVMNYEHENMTSHHEAQTPTPTRDSKTASPPTRASSAPPDSPNISPRKPTKPRVSDDTALLQAFLNRAAETKTSRRLSASEKESLTNRRDSDTVRQALAASPARQEVLGDLDPNTSSPRKVTVEMDVDTMDWRGESSEQTTAILAEKAVPDNTNSSQPDESSEEPSTKRTRSGRERKKPQVYAQSSVSIPPRITIRGTVGGANDVHVQRSNAQELAYVTKSNTRKNKITALSVRARLVELGEEASKAEEVEMEEAESAVKVSGKKSLVWAENLVSFYQGGSMDVDVSQLSDVSEERMPWERGADFDPTAEAVDEVEKKAVPAALTPSKPKSKSTKMRKLKTPAKTASSAIAGTPLAGPAKGERADVEAEMVEVKSGGIAKDEKPKAVPKARRSRIATPAKGLTHAAHLPELAVVPATIPLPAPVPIKTDKAENKIPAPSRKRTAASRLPAPGTITAQPTTASAALMSSPAKKPRLNSSLLSTDAFASNALPTGGKLFAPKLNFGASQGSKTASAVDSALGDMPDLMSPAKKPRTAGPAFGSVSGIKLAEVEDESRPVLAGLASPAKRGRRRAA
ncbi:hypothetical protein LTR62_003210 [Meristemomyces frigidus]|uniref:Uncharacterized protein n=1 Tax=Meristemomyces frigidus TaxID=1508187 RepID=A0AAN7TFS8_9PEZI|nr:hypothetical protein LTR62_003210 [Meristemomyces frigidus]